MGGGDFGGAEAPPPPLPPSKLVDDIHLVSMYILY